MNTNVHKNSSKNKLKISSFIILMGLVSTVIVQFFISTPYYSLARLSLYGIFLMGTLMYLPFFKFKKDYFILVYSILMFLVLTNGLLVNLLTDKNTLNIVLQPVFSFVILMLGYNIKVPKKFIKKTLKLYVIITTLLGIFIIFFLGEGLSITQTYFLGSKNQVGPFIAMCCLGCLHSFSKKNKEKMLFFNRKILMILFIVNFAVLLTIRNRSGVVAFLGSILFYLVSKIDFTLKKEKIVFFPIIILLIGVILYSSILTPIFDYIYDALFLNYEITDINSLSAGRIDTYMDAFNFIKKYPLFGELRVSSGITIAPHNYLLNILTQFGIIGMFPLVGLYIFIWIYIIKKIIIDKEEELSIYLLLLLLIISLFEPTYPYSPVTTVSLTWFLLGYYLNSFSKV